MDDNKCQCWLVKQNRQCSYKPIEGTSGFCGIHKDHSKRKNCRDMGEDASKLNISTGQTEQTKLKPTTKKKTERTKLQPMTTKNPEQTKLKTTMKKTGQTKSKIPITKKMEQSNSDVSAEVNGKDTYFGMDISNQPTDIINNICNQLIDGDDYNAVENLIKTHSRIKKICQPVYMAQLAKERANPTTIDEGGDLLWTVKNSGAKPYDAPPDLFGTLLHRDGGFPP